jgi:beta-barrel assembly-enhancing protease
VKPALRVSVLVVLIACGVALITVLHRARVQPPLESTFTSAFQVLGAPLKLADRAASRVLPVSALDEKKLGDVYREHFDAQATPASPAQLYVDSLLAELQPLTGKPFPYRAYLVDYPGPNAMALPGGVVLVTRDLLTTLRSEAELVAVLAHELGHIELGHCFDTVRFELLTRKVGARSLGTLADFAASILLRHSFSKTMEHEADTYAFELLTHSRYDPRGVGGGFEALLAYVQAYGGSSPQQASPIRDYFSSHPPLEVRATEFGELASVWWRRNPDELRYTGRRNLHDLLAMSRLEFSDEWVGQTGSSP